MNTSNILKNLVIFKNLSGNPLIMAVCGILDCKNSSTEVRYAKCCDLARELYLSGDDLTEAVFDLISYDENVYVKAVSKSEKVEPNIEKWLEYELKALSEAAAFSSEVVKRILTLSECPEWRASQQDFVKRYKKYMENVQKKGYGLFARHSVFTVSEDGEILPVRNPDPQQISALYGYEAEREKVIANTVALLEGKPAANVLLYGDAGTGKSSTVKAIVNKYAECGLRLIQVEKSLLHHIPTLLDSLADNPLKFIIFIDDLSFASNDRDFTALKTVLEGSVAVRAKNTAVYATSNRRHLVRESFESRVGSDLHLNDTIQESTSLAARFGMTVTFVKPDKNRYTEVLLGLAEQYGVLDNQESLIKEAEAFAIRNGGRSPRTAKQYIEYKISSK